MNDRTAYLVHVLAWALPLLAVQIGVLVARDGRRAIASVRAVAPAVLGVSAWLSLADAVAVAAGIWRFGPGLSGVALAGLPVEEVLFFVVSNGLVAGGVLLFGGGVRA
jgi:lycopene cyclase domain-containing protein